MRLRFSADPVRDRCDYIGCDDEEGEVVFEEGGREDDEEEAKPKRSKFLKSGEDEESSDEDEGKRVVKSAREKRLEEMEGAGKQMDNALKINDWVAISNGA